MEIERLLAIIKSLSERYEGQGFFRRTLKWEALLDLLEEIEKSISAEVIYCAVCDDRLGHNPDCPACSAYLTEAVNQDLDPNFKEEKDEGKQQPPPL